MLCMARPKAGEEKDRDAHVGVRVKKWIRAGLEKIAKEDGVVLSDVAHEAFAAYLKRRGIREH
jgi:hypothetical protein